VGTVGRSCLPPPRDHGRGRPRTARDRRPGGPDHPLPRLVPAGRGHHRAAGPHADGHDPAAEGHSGLRVYIGGTTAIWSGFSHVLDTKLALFVMVIVALSFAVLTPLFRSLAIPLAGAAMNLLFIGAALGIMVAAFQWNWPGPALGIGRLVPGQVLSCQQMDRERHERHESGDREAGAEVQYRVAP
jgi:MMPL family